MCHRKATVEYQVLRIRDDALCCVNLQTSKSCNRIMEISNDFKVTLCKLMEKEIKEEAMLDCAIIDLRKQMEKVVDCTIEEIRHIWSNTRPRIEILYTQASFDMDLMDFRSGFIQELIGTVERDLKVLEKEVKETADCFIKERQAQIDCCRKIIQEEQRLRDEAEKARLEEEARLAEEAALGGAIENEECDDCKEDAEENQT